MKTINKNCLSILLLSPFCINAKANDDFSQLLSMDISELLNVKVTGVGSLTETRRYKVPAAVTQISSNDIGNSGARSLHELLDIHVPGVQWIRHHWEFSHIGSRGIINDRENKLLIRVNGRVMNEKTHNGAVSERNFPMLKDIEYINVIRGAGSALYGLGAVSMVIDIKTYNAKTKKDNELHLQASAKNQFYSIEGNMSKTFDNNLQAYFYGAVGVINGAEESDAPVIIGTDAVSIATGEFIPRGEPFPVGVDDGLQYDDRAPMKLHLELNNESTNFWLRYTRAGEVEPTDVFFVAAPPVGVGVQPRMQMDNGYQQLTALVEHEYIIDEDLALSGLFSYDAIDMEQISPFSADKASGINYREDEWLLKLGGQWTGLTNSDIYIGTEFSYEIFGLDSLGAGRDKPYSNRLGEMESWSTLTSSLLSEWQWRPHEHLTTFVSARVDKNTYTDVLLSPRASVVWSSNDIDIFKLMLTRSQRMNFAEDNRAGALIGNTKQDPEVLDSIEARYQHIEKTSQYSLSTFYIQLDALSWDNTLKQSILTGEQKQWGLELEFEKRIDNHQLNFSHSYTKLIDFELSTPTSNTLISAKPYGFGDDLNAWSNHTSKVRYSYHLNEQINFNASLRVYWGFPGVSDYWDKYNDDGLTLMDTDWEKGAEEQVFLNVGGNYQINQSIKVAINFYNILGVFDEDYNKRLYYNSYGDYRSESEDVVLSLTATF
jgi:iron complex outermembrane receptor protein